MSYLLDDKKILLKDFIAKNEDLLHEKEHTELENEIFLSLIEKYEAKRKMLKIIQFTHYICTTIYEYEHNINFEVDRKHFFSELENFLENSINLMKESFNCIIDKSKNEKEKTEIEAKREKNQEEEEGQEHSHSIYQNEVILKNNLYDINIEETILHQRHRERETAEKNENREPPSENKSESKRESEQYRQKEITDDVSTNVHEKQMKDDIVGKTNSEFFENVEKMDSTSSSTEKKICIYWSEEKPKDNFVMTQLIKKTERTNDGLLNMKEKLQLVLNEIEKLKNEIKKISLYFENTQIIINSIICQSKIFLFELEEERKLYEAEKEKIKSDKNLMKKSNTLHDFYNKLIEKQQKKIGDLKKTNKTLLNLYKKKFANMNYLISLNENINNVDFLYLNVLIYNKKLNYDKLMKDYERNYSHLRKMLNEIKNSDQSIKENEKKEKEIKRNIQKNNEMLNGINKLIVTITNEIEKSKKSSNKISDEENSDILNNHSILDCIHLNKEISEVEKKIRFFQRKIETLQNVKTKK